MGSDLQRGALRLRGQESTARNVSQRRGLMLGKIFRLRVVRVARKMPAGSRDALARLWKAARQASPGNKRRRAAALPEKAWLGSVLLIAVVIRAVVVGRALTYFGARPTIPARD